MTNQGAGMSEGAGLEVGQRRRQRVDIERPAWLHVDGFEKPFAARIVNLSLAGAFLRADRTWSKGMSFMCRFVLAGEMVVLRCRVVRVETSTDEGGSPPGPGMGVAFSAPGRAERTALCRALGQDPSAPDLQTGPIVLLGN